MLSDFIFSLKIYFYQLKILFEKTFKNKHKYLNSKIFYFNLLLFEFLKDNRLKEKRLKIKLYDLYTKFVNLCIKNGELDKAKLTYIFTQSLPNTNIDFFFISNENFPFALQPKIKEIFNKFYLDLYFKTKQEDWIEFDEFEELLKTLKKDLKKYLNKYEKQSKLVSKKEIKRNNIQNIAKELINEISN